MFTCGVTCLEIIPIRRQLSLVERSELCEVGVLWTDDTVIHPHLRPSVAAVVGLGRVTGAQLLDAVGVAQRVQGVLARSQRGRDHGDLARDENSCLNSIIKSGVISLHPPHHASFRLFADERIPKDLREFAGPEGQVAALSPQCADALL